MTPEPHIVAEALGCEVRLRAALALSQPGSKCESVLEMDRQALGRGLALRRERGPEPVAVGRPLRPRLVRPRDVPRRGLGSADGRAALVHAVAHIEFNAINLALDAALRFAGMPPAYYSDWIGVAQDEARHFCLLEGRLRALGHGYGDFTAHNGLWESAEKTAHDVLLRMALVPRVLEARGLDVTPGMIHRLEEAGDRATADILRLILAEEVAHVRIGTHWFHHLCAERRLDPLQTFRELIADRRNHLRGPFNWPAREAAGFSREELQFDDLPGASVAGTSGVCE